MSYYICTDCALMLALVIGLFCSLFVIYLILWLLRIGLCDLFTYCQKKCRERWETNRNANTNNNNNNNNNNNTKITPSATPNRPSQRLPRPPPPPPKHVPKIGNNLTKQISTSTRNVERIVHEYESDQTRLNHKKEELKSLNKLETSIKIEQRKEKHTNKSSLQQHKETMLIGLDAIKNDSYDNQNDLKHEVELIKNKQQENTKKRMLERKLKKHEV